MKILHLPESCLPWRTGGKEVYCHQLCLELARAGVSNVISVHRNAIPGTDIGSYEFEGVPIHVLPDLPDYNSRLSTYTKTFPSLPGFSEMLDEISPDLVHFHDQGGGASLSHLRIVKAKRIPSLITFHSPGQTCPQRELLRYGSIPCDGEVRLGRCTACRLNVSGVPRPLAHVASLAEWPGFDPASPSRVARVLTGRATTRMFRDSLHEFFRLADGLIVLADWSREVLLRNEAPVEKIHLIRTGGREPYRGLRRKGYPETEVLEIACLGRCTPIKGLHILVDAVKQLPSEAPIRVHFLGPYWDDSAYGKSLTDRISGDPRFVQPRMIENSELLGVLAEMDVVVIPSLWLETGPLTLFDALAARVPVIGSRLGGLAELIVEGSNGWLFEAGHSAELSMRLRNILSNPSELLNLRQSAAPLRTMRNVTADYLPVYEALARN